MTDPRVSDLYDRIRSCAACALSRTRTNAVPGSGPANADIMLIGEAPGKNEDEQGLPFVGAAGKFLDELIGAAGLTRDQVYICNVLKCRPPGNRDPEPGEIKACDAFLQEQFRVIDPLVVVTLGRFSMARFFPNATISRVHGQARLRDERVYVPMYHPAAALHQRRLRDTIIEDFRKLPALVEKARGRREQVRAGIDPQASAKEPDAQPGREPTAAGLAPPPSEPAQPRLFE